MADAHAYARALEALRLHYGYRAFRPAQVPVVRSVLAGRDTLAILPTGGGKSICFQIPAVALGGLTLVVSPLISLMQDQVDAATSRGLPAVALHSAITAKARDAAMTRIAEGKPMLVYCSPERLERLAPELLRLGARPRLLVVDEAHCIAEWGHDFRPSYRRLREARRRLGMPQVLALTGSATPEVRGEIMRSLAMGGGAPHDLHLGSFDRRNLWFGVVRVRDERERLRALVELLRTGDRTAIVYAPTRGLVEGIAGALGRAGWRATPYHAGLGAAARREALDAFLSDRVDVVVATCAFGMGIDKPTVRLVVHWQLPATPEAYYQEAGRAGRDGRAARCMLLYRSGDATVHRRQLDVTFPARRLLERVWAGKGKATGVPRNVLESAERLRRELRPERGPVDWRPVRARRARAESRIDAMERYASGRGCRRSRLLEYFGERLPTGEGAGCAGCDRCRPPAPPGALPAAVRERLDRLRAALARGPARRMPLEPGTLLRLAARPPSDAAELADVPGVGPIVAERLGGTILDALGVDGTSPPAVPATLGVPAADSSLAALHEWRRRAALEAGVPDYTLVGDAALTAIAAAAPVDPAALRRLAVLGPVALARHGDALLAILHGSKEV